MAQLKPRRSWGGTDPASPSRKYSPQIKLTISYLFDIQTITDLAEQKAQYLGLHTYRTRNFPSEGAPSSDMSAEPVVHQSAELLKLGPAARGTLFVQLSNFPDYYLVLVITDEDFRYALISVKAHTDS